MLHGHALLPLFQALAHAQDGAQPGLQRGAELAVDALVALGKEGAALGVADDDVFDAQLPQHGGGDFAGVGAGGGLMHVLGADGDLAAAHGLDRRGNIHKGHAQHAVAPLGLV